MGNLFFCPAGLTNTPLREVPSACFLDLNNIQAVISTFPFDATKTHSGSSIVVGLQGRVSDPGGSRVRGVFGALDVGALLRVLYSYLAGSLFPVTLGA